MPSGSRHRRPGGNAVLIGNGGNGGNGGNSGNAGKSGGAPGPSGAGGAGGLLLGENGLNGLM
uniref:PE-PGRS family protein n=1 Tax=Mycobacterium tuberculosis TaxID=1773 RepID=UPI00099ED23A|nr:PE-PGRS family protein [Mycobacterium tuberculosis]